MLFRIALIAGAVALAAVPAQAQTLDQAPPGGAYKKVSELVKLPDFLPGMGTLYVDARTLPAGPFLAYDHDGKLVSTIYMIPVEDIQGKKKFDDLTATGGPSTTSTCITTPAIRVWRSPITTSSSGTWPGPTRRAWPSSMMRDARCCRPAVGSPAWPSSARPWGRRRLRSSRSACGATRTARRCGSTRSAC